jgi:hypothetical protein
VNLHPPDKDIFSHNRIIYRYHTVLCIRRIQYQSGYRYDGGMIFSLALILLLAVHKGRKKRVTTTFKLSFYLKNIIFMRIRLWLRNRVKTVFCSTPASAFLNVQNFLPNRYFLIEMVVNADWEQYETVQV